MASSDVKQFLVIYDIQREHADVVEFGTDHERALKAYEEAEEGHRNDPDHEVVLLGSDSIATLRKTHASYFGLDGDHIEQVVGRKLAKAGARVSDRVLEMCGWA
jgi:hypothetical protein